MRVNAIDAISFMKEQKIMLELLPYRSNMQIVTGLVIMTCALIALKSFMSGSGNMERSLIAYRRKRK